MQIGTRTARNRVMFGPHVTNLGRGRSLSDRHVAYYARRAVGGAGVIVIEEASVHESDWPYERSPLATECETGWAEIASACQAEGSLVIAAIGHAGMQGSSAYSQRETWAPSPVPDAATREQPKAMEEDDFKAVLNGFMIAAATAARSGCDGVEINAGQHSLVRQFMSGLTNQRTDEWGLADGANRLAFPKAVIARARQAVGPGQIVGLRLSCDELAPWAGLTPESAAEAAAELAELVDYLVVVRGSIYSADGTTPDAHNPAGFNLDLVRDIRTAVAGKCPVIAQGSIVDWGQAEWTLTDGRADAVEMTRAQIADPDLCLKLAAERTAEIRPCILCNQRCRVRDSRNPIVSCVVNPTTGFELTEPESLLNGLGSDPKAFVHVVGAGPAGLEAARVCAEAGLEVTVWEASESQNKVVRTWAAASGREPLAKIADWLEAECARLGVTVHYNETITPEQVAAWLAEGASVLAAVGSQTRSLEYTVSDDGVVIDALEFLGDRELPDGPVVVWDPIGGPIGISIAETLAPDRSVSLIAPDQIAGTLLSLSGDLASASTRLAQAGVYIAKRSELASVENESATIESRVDGSSRVIRAVAVIDAGHRVPSGQAQALADAGATLIGDAVAPRSLYEAMLEGRRAAIALGVTN